MTDDPADLRSLFDDAVADVVPTDRLGEIRRRTAEPPPRSRRWGLVLAAGTATAAVVGGVAVFGQLASPDSPDPAGSDDRQAAVAAYFVVTTPEGDRLYREFQPGDATGDAAAHTLEALRLLEVGSGAKDPDYVTNWPDGAFVKAEIDSDGIRLTISDAAADHPSLLSGAGLQQAVFTAQAAAGRTTPVTFATRDRVVRADVTRDPALAAPINISDPSEGHVVDDQLTLRGTVAPDTRAVAIAWQLRNTSSEVVASGEAPLAGATWETTADISDLVQGIYELSVSLPEGNSTTTDTRTITVR